MKNNYVKSIGLILLGGILSSSIYSFSSRELITAKILPTTKNTDKIPRNMVSIDTAINEVAAYQTLLNFLPESVTVDTLTNTLTYSKKTNISGEDIKTLVNFSKELFPGLKFSGTQNSVWLPLNGVLDHSYYIKIKDIEMSLSYIKAQKDFKENEDNYGINLYLALKGFQPFFMGGGGQSHLYIVPTKKNNITNTLEDYLIKHNDSTFTLEDHSIKPNESLFALDLTEPCPALCAKKSLLYNPQLKP